MAVRNRKQLNAEKDSGEKNNMKTSAAKIEKEDNVLTVPGMFAALLSGTAFGVAIDKANLNKPYALEQQMSFSSFTMMRLFLVAAATSTFIVTMAMMLGMTPPEQKPATRLGLRLFGGYGGNVVGGFLVGIGMYLSGACPGTIWTQVGAFPGLRTATIVFGGILGTITLAYLQPLLRAKNKDFMMTTPDPISGNLKLRMGVATSMFVCICVCVYLLDLVFPWEKEMDKIIHGDTHTLKGVDTVWDPLHAGLVVGLVQVPALLFIGSPFGMSRAFVVFSSHICSLFDSRIRERAPYFSKYQYQKAANYQVLISIGAVIGAYLSFHVLTSSEVQLKYHEPVLARQENVLIGDFVGGFLMLFGARLGGGCTSGHGLSGMALGSVASVVTVACMFAGGLLTSLIV
uniref:Sulphur transport domain-containing protein n=1 Tax=Aplanochytrium stocchinoi TaxID=215587 RepID=A0A7S3LHI4_9STRA|mmetsp:Transcript_1972/g.2533  ORF Transcript_1972/g.2533 Transcript_1972/m.2533 type:complete len:401 (+) Transcript_1972:158-1360(+)|eukprot:CAMPEP_0204824358 /NCGR_PEP_ID=MMETSP1346-20131115/2369_1 /ASSEMBLY_ACC=CAM_ASM_000771 /TAXON_ID=215587 /ORGANISM="Aplanochytrium stocchinoi, Strain GSBS06" /LENGTH=400 /DNA_ID=CAMNT_0051951459 /DNA_START=250 /DNA_END=1452 /DNA_ORIENTATION=+